MAEQTCPHGGVQGRLCPVRGTTLVEAMVTLAIVAILASLGIPGLTGFLKDARRDGLVLDLMGALNYCRSQAILRGHNVTLCPSADGLACLGVGQWELGWIVFADADSDGVVQESEELLRRHPPVQGDATIRGGKPRVTYQSSGFSPGYNDTLRICDGRGTAEARSVVISMQGRARVRKQANNCP